MYRFRGRTLKIGVLFLFLIAGMLQFAPTASPQASVQGQWQTLPITVPFNPVHAALMHNGKVLIVSGSGSVPSNTDFESVLWDPKTDTLTTQKLGWDMFCSGMVVLPDGRPFIVGGTLQYDPFFGQLRAATYDPTTNLFTDQPSMAHGRWYPTATVLGDGRVMVFSGTNETGTTNNAVEIYTVGSGWGPAATAPWTPPLYPRMTVLPNGNVFYSGSGTASNIFNPMTTAWTTNVATTNYSGRRTYGSSVLLPLTPANNYEPQVMILGGGNPATKTTEIIDPLAATPAWVFGPDMTAERIEMNATILPTGKILALGGSLNDEDLTTAALNADLYDPNLNTFTSAGTEAFARLYHSVSLLLPDATVWVAGSNPVRGTYEPHMEIYSPAYLFNSDGSLATRPTITSVSNPAVGYGSAFTVTTPDAANISTVVLMKNGAVTHAFNMDQRYVGLSFTKGSGVLNVTAPPNGNIAPPGYYMLFLVNNAGVPSVASMVQLSLAPGDTPPTGTITTPTGNPSIAIGGSVSYAGTGTPGPGSTISSYFWSFEGGTPSTSTLANPGTVTYSKSGTFATSLTVTDNHGINDPHPPTRTITVIGPPNFGASVSPSSQSINQGASAPYTVTITPNNGFTGTVALGVSGVPAGATAGFSSSSVNITGASSDSSTLTISTTGTSTPTGVYTLTITATSGTLTHTTTTTLIVSAAGSTTPINFGSGFTGTGMQFNGHTALNESRLRLTDSTATNETASAFWTTPVNVQNFTNVFSFQLTNPNADGFTFTIQNAGVTAIGSPGGGLGYGKFSTSTASIAKSVAVKFDLYNNSGEGTNSTGLYTNGASPTVPATTLGGGVNLHSGDIFQVQMTYDGTTLSMTITDTTTPADTFTTSWPINIPSTVGANTALVGFTAGTGGQTATQEITTWTYSTLSASGSNFSVVVSPSSQSVTQGASVPYTATITPTNGFTGTVTFSVSGLPTGATASFSPTSVTTSGSSTMTVSTASSTPAGGYSLTVTATSGTLVHTTTTVLDVAQSGTPTPINFGSGFSTAGMQFNGHTKLNGTRLQLTDGSTTSETASAFWTTPVNIQRFTNTFTFQQTNPNADGFTFTIQNAGATAIGPPGGGLGYGPSLPSGTPGIGKSVAVKFDLYSNDGEGTNSTGLYTNGASPTVPATTLGGGVNLHSGDIFQVQMTYDGTTLSMTITDTTTPADTFTTSWPINIPSTVGANTALVGFTAGTGGQTSTQEILAWNFSSGSSPPPASTPTFSPVGGTYSTTQSVSISDTTLNMSIFYTLDGTAPGTAVGGSTHKYSTPITVASTDTINALATASGFSTSSTATATYTITSSDFVLGVSPASQSVTQGARVPYTATITPTNGFTGTVTFSVSGLPTGATASFSPTSVTTSGSSTMTVSTASSTPTGSYTLTVTATSGTLTHTATTTLVVAQSGGTAAINFGSGFSTAGMQFNGHTKLNGTRLQLTDGSTTSEAASAFWTTPVNVQNFTNVFSFQLTNPNADGFTFTIQNAGVTAIGPPGGGLGYGPSLPSGTPGIGKSVAVKFDLYSNDGEGTNSTGLYTNGASPTVPATTLGGGVNLHSGDIFQVQMTYDGTTLSMTITDTTTPADTFTTSWPINIPSTVGANTALVGFTAGTGGQTATQEITTWTYSTLSASGSNFSVVVSPSSQSVTQGASVPYTATITPTNGFTGTVTFSVSGLPTGATASFSPTSVTTSGSSTMTVSTASSTPAGGYSLTVTATSGTLVHTTTTVLDVAQSGTPTPINFGSGFSTAGMQFNGHTKLNGTRLQLTDGSTTSETASAFWTTPVNIQRFTNTFTFQQTNPNADGFTFTIQNAGATAIGPPGGGLGYGPSLPSGTPGIGKSVAVKFDLYSNDGEGTNSTGLYTNGASPTVPATTLGGGVNLHSGDIFQVQMTYDGTTLSMTITDTTTPADTFTTSWPINIPSTVGANTALVGFTAGTGGQTSTQEIVTWTYTTP